MNYPIIPAGNSGWHVKEFDLGLILAGETKPFNLAMFNSFLIQDLTLSATTAGMFNLTIYSRQARAIKDVIQMSDSSETNLIRIQDFIYDDLDKQNMFYITIINDSPAGTQYNMVVKYD